MKRRILSIFMSVIVLINIIVPVCASAADATDKNSSVYIGNGYIVYYDVKSSWGDNQNIEIKIKNIGSEPIANWALKYDAHGEISGLWNATAYSNNDTQYIIKNAGYNYEIQPDQEVNFGYCVTGESLEVPKAFEICSQRTDKAENEYIVSLNVTNDWGTGFTGEIKIQNLSSEPIEAWRLNFDANFTIEDIWNARLVSADENSYCIANDVTTTPIAANETKTFGFKASKENGVTAEIYNCTVNGVTISENFETLEFLETGLVLTAFAQYNQTESAIDIYWNTTVQNGTYEILESDDNVKYNKITETSDFMFYSYKILENFSEKYFIVRQTTNDGRTVEADPILISNNGNGYSVGFPDTDGDGIPDYLEKDIGTDPQKADTDDDGLTDYEEFYLTGTDSTVYDSITEDVSDADADSDKDGLSNKKELDLGTNPLLEDTDKDGLSDGAETIIYGTDPLKYDTDDDGIGDGDEIALGLDPLNPQTFGVPDSEYTFEVDVPSDVESFSDINTDTNPFEVSVKMKAAGNILSNLDARESVYSKAMTNDATLGICPEFIYDDGCKIEEAVIQFKIDDEYAAEADTEKAEDSEFYGIKKYSIFKFFEDTGTLLPVKTEIDEENNTLSTTVDSLGSYCVIDMEKLLNNWLESEVETEEQTEVFQIVRSSVMYATMQMANNDTDVSAAETKTHIKETDPVNVFFFLDNRNTVGDEAFALAKESIVSASDIILKKSSDAHIYVVLCTNASSGAAYKLIDGNCADDSFTDISSLEGELDSITLRSTNTLSDNCVLSDALNYALDNYNKDRATYCFYLFNQKNVLFRESTGRSYLSKAKTAGFNVSIISEIDKAYIDGYALDLYKETDGIHIKKFSNFSNDILKHMYSSVPVIDDDTETYNMLLASGLQKVTLDAPITEDYKEAALDMWNNPNSTKYSDYADTDEDGLYDFQEIDFISDRIKFVNGKVKLPSFQDCLNEKSDLFYVEDGLSKYIAQIEKDDSLINMTDLRHKIYDKTYLLPILSDPTDETGDTDGDGFVDYYEYKCHENRNTENLDTSINYLNGLREDEWQAKSDLGRLVRIAGFNYDQQQKILRSDQYPIQRFFGFNRSIDVAADTVLSSSIYCDPICFFYDGKEYMLELWKGQYGIMSGAEVGLYYRTPTVYTRTITVADLVELVETIVNGLVDFEDVGIDVNEVIYQLARELSDDNILIEICDFLGVDLPELINNIIDMSYDLEDICDFLGIDLFDTVIYEHTYLDDYGCNYDPDNYYDEKWYRSVAPQDMIDVYYEFGIKKDKSTKTDITEFERKDYHWWTTGFEWGKYTESEDEIVMKITIDFNDPEMKKAFIDGGVLPEQIINSKDQLDLYQKHGLTSFISNSNNRSEGIGRIETEESATEVVLTYNKYGFNTQPQSSGDKDYIQANNLALLDVYETAKEVAGIAYEYDSTNKLDRLLYTNDPNLITVDDFIYGFDATNFFAFNSPHTEFLKHAIAENAFGVDGDYTWALYNSLVTNLANNAVSFSYSKEYWSSLLNVGSSVLDVVDALGVQLTVGDVLGILLLTGNNTNDLRLIAEQIADTKYTDGYSTQYLYEYYEDWYMQYAQMYDIMATSDNYDWNHFPGLIFSTEFVVNRVKNLRAS